MTGWWERFWFKPQPTASLAVVRIVFGLLVFTWTLSLAPDLDAFFGRAGLLSGQIGGAGVWGVLGIFRGDLAVQVLFVVLLLASFGLIVGYQTRLAAVLVFVGVMSFERRDPYVFNTGDGLVRLIAFYLMLAPAGAALSLDRFLAARERFWEPPWRAPWALRLMQIQLSVLYLAGLWIKLQGTTWNDGTAVSYALRISDLHRLPLPSFVSHSLLIANLLTYGTLAVEASVAILVWNRRLRPWVLLIGACLHVGIEWSIRVGFFSLAMLTLYLSFLDPHWAQAQLLGLRRRLGQRPRAGPRASQPSETPCRGAEMTARAQPRPRRGPLRLALAIVALAIAAILPAPSSAAGGPILLRTLRVAPPGVDPNGPSFDPSIGGGGLLVAFDSQASNLGPVVGNGRLGNVYVFNIVDRRVVLVSAGTNGPANGSSFTPSLSAGALVVAFASRATNLVAGISTRFSEVYARDIRGPIGLVSRTFGNQPPDGDSTQPAVSANGRFVAFTSTADNLVAGDDNAAADVFVADLATGKIQRVSVSSAGGQGDGPSYNPSISADGRLVSFTSAASSLAPGDINGVPDVFVHDMATGTTEQVSVSSTGAEQNRSIARPFTQISGLSGDGHYVVFDSDATNLVGRDRNGHTDVFRYNLLTGQVARVSTSSVGQQGDNDSFAPATSADGRVTVFESFSDNLASPWAPNENVFAQDLLSRSTLTLDVTPAGGPRGPEVDYQLLQRPAVSPNGLLVAFASGADNLVANDFNGTDDLFLRVITPPTTTIVQAPPATTSNRRPVVEFRGNSPLAIYGLCDLDGHRRTCPVGRPFRLPRVRPGHHVLTVRAGAPGTLFDPKGAVVGFTEG